MIFFNKTKNLFFCFILFSLVQFYVLPSIAANDALSFLDSSPVSVDSYGAVGDGIHDDSLAIQTAFDNNTYVSFTAGKTYKLISNGLYIRNNLVIEGNNSIILIDDSYNPNKKDFSKHIIRHAYNSQSNFLNINDLNIDVQIKHNTYSSNNGKNYLCIFQPTYINNISLENVNINVCQSENKIINLWLDHGCDSFIMKNSTLKNFTTYKEGGVLWFMSSEDKLFNEYTDYKNIEIYNCTFEGICGDEIVSLYGSYSANASFEDCNIIGNNQSPNTTRPITIYSNGHNTYYDVIFNNCYITCMYNTSIKNCSYDSFIGIGSNTSKNYFNINFNHCSINASVQNCLLYPNLIQKNITNIHTYNSNPNVEINFSSCNIICDKPISGSCSQLIRETQDLIALGFNMNNCNIICNNSLAVLTPIWTNNNFYYYTPTINLEDNHIYIYNPTALFVSKYSNLDAIINISNNHINNNISNSSCINQNTISYFTQQEN